MSQSSEKDTGQPTTAPSKDLAIPTNAASYALSLADGRVNGKTLQSLTLLILAEALNPADERQQRDPRLALDCVKHLDSMMRARSPKGNADDTISAAMARAKKV